MVDEHTVGCDLNNYSSPLVKRTTVRAFGGGPGFDYILSSFVPRMHRYGVPLAVTQKMLVHNASSAFSLILPMT